MSLRPSTLRAALLTTFVLAMTPSLASADLPPPDGSRFVGFSFAITGLGAAPSRVLFTYPCGSSNGAPMAEHHKIEEGKPISVGRRGGGCPIYSVDKAKYEAWAKDYKPAGGSSDPEVEKLVKMAIRCEGGPLIQHTLPKDDPRPGVEQTITVATLNDTTCKLNVPAMAAAPSAAPKPAPSAAPTSTQSSAPSNAPAPAQKSGCGVARGPNEATSLAAMGGLVAWLLLAVRRRRSDLSAR